MLRAAKSLAVSSAFEVVSFEPAPLKSHNYLVLLDLGFFLVLSFEVQGFQGFFLFCFVVFFFFYKLFFFCARGQAAVCMVVSLPAQPPVRGPCFHKVFSWGMIACFLPVLAVTNAFL